MTMISRCASHSQKSSPRGSKSIQINSLQASRGAFQARRLSLDRLALSILLLGQRLTAGAVAGSLVSIAGVAVVVSSGDLGALLKSGANMGDGLMLLAMLAYAVYVILLKRWGMKEVPALQLLYLQIVFAVIALLPMYLLTPKMGLSAANLPLIGFAGLGASMLAPLVWMHTVAHIGPSRASMFFNLIPLFTAVIAAVVIGESLAAYHAVGGVLTVAGVLLAELWKAPLRQRRALAS